jgi:hypothetical protein
MHSPQLGSIAFKGAQALSRAIQKSRRMMAGSSPANFFKIVMFGFADILALLAAKTIGELRCSAPGATNASLTPKRETPLYYLAIISPADRCRRGHFKIAGLERKRNN